LIQLCDLTKYYGKTRGIENVDLKVDEGEVFGFLGPNGAGKTTTIRILMDLIRPSSGKAMIMGYDCNTESDKIKGRVGYLPGEFSAYSDLTCRQYLNYLAGFYRDSKVKERVKELTDYFELDISRLIGQCSQGMKKKVGLIQAFMADCRLYILDEPSKGLDPLHQQKLYALIADMQKKGKSIFLSSHILTEVEQACDRVAIIREGRIIEIDSIQNLTRKKFKNVRVVYKSTPSQDFFEKEGIDNLSQKNSTFMFLIKSQLNENLKHILSRPVEDITVSNPSLEDIFMEYYREPEEERGEK